MQKIISFFVLLFVCISSYAMSQLEKFTGLQYGMTKDQVEAVLKRQGASVNSYMESTNFRINLNFKPDISRFKFHNGKLYACSFGQKNIKYETALQELTASLGQPTFTATTVARWNFPNEKIALVYTIMMDDFDELFGLPGTDYLTLDFIEVDAPAQSNTQKPTPQPAVTQPSMNGDITLKGYTWKWDEYYGNSHERENGTFTLEFMGKNHYLGANFNKLVTNITDSDKERNRWTTRYGKINIKLPKGVEVKKNDETICWERNFSSGNKSIVLFIWTPSTGQLQCLNTYDSNWEGRRLHDIEYFRTTDASAWPQIKAVLMRELPYCAIRVD